MHTKPPFLLLFLSLWFFFSCFGSFHSHHGKLKLVKASPERGYQYPFYLYVPDSLAFGDILRMVVEPNNSGFTSDKLREHRKKARRLASNDYYLGNYVSRRLGQPLLVPVFPRPAYDRKLYTHALDRDAVTQKGNSLERIDLQLLAMVDHAQEMLEDKGYRVHKEFFLTGFSASGTFSNRFTAIHPRRVHATAAGGVNGLLFMPYETLHGGELIYPVGVFDFESLFGKPFDREGFCQTPQYLFMGEKDTNDAIPYDDG